MSDLHNRVSKLLRGLGSSASQIAQKLKRAKIKGYPTSIDCPIARYLRKRLGPDFSISVRTGGVVIRNPHRTVHLAINVPVPVMIFINTFDAGRYPFLKYKH